LSISAPGLENLGLPVFDFFNPKGIVDEPIQTKMGVENHPAAF